MKIIAIDPGTQCGYAGNFSRIGSGVWDLKVKKGEGKGIRYLRLKNALGPLLVLEPDVVVYEAVARHAGTIAAHVYGGLIATLMVLCEERGVRYEPVPVGTWKKAVLGKGNAKKPTILQFAQQNFKAACTSSDEADALCMLEWAERTLDPIAEILS